MAVMRPKLVCHVVCQFVLLAILAACQEQVTAEKNPCPESAQQFWKTFRSAILKNDIQAIADITQFPFQLSVGSLDFNRKEILLNRKKFIAIFPKLLPVDPGISEAHKTMKGYAEAMSSIPSKSCMSDGALFRIGDWVYELKPEGWRFVQAFAGEEFEL